MPVAGILLNGGGGVVRGTEALTQWGESFRNVSLAARIISPMFLNHSACEVGTLLGYVGLPTLAPRWHAVYEPSFI